VTFLGVGVKTLTRPTYYQEIKTSNHTGCTPLGSGCINVQSNTFSNNYKRAFLRHVHIITTYFCTAYHMQKIK